MYAGEVERRMPDIRGCGPCLFTTSMVGPVEKIAITTAMLHNAAMLVANALHRHRLSIMLGPKGTTAHTMCGLCCHFAMPSPVFQAQIMQGREESSTSRQAIV